MMQDHWNRIWSAVEAYFSGRIGTDPADVRAASDALIRAREAEVIAELAVQLEAGDRARSQCAESEAASVKQNVLRAMAYLVEARVQVSEEVDPSTPVAVFPSLNCPGTCGFRQRGLGWQCVEGDACGRFVDQANNPQAVEEIERHHRAMTDAETIVAAPTPCGRSWDRGGLGPKCIRPQDHEGWCLFKCASEACKGEPWPASVRSHYRCSGDK